MDGKQACERMVSSSGFFWFVGCWHNLSCSTNNKQTLSLSDPGFRTGPKLVQDWTEQDIFQSWSSGTLRGRKRFKNYRYHYLLSGCLQRLFSQKVSGKSCIKCLESVLVLISMCFVRKIRERGRLEVPVLWDQEPGKQIHVLNKDTNKGPRQTTKGSCFSVGPRGGLLWARL